MSNEQDRRVNPRVICVYPVKVFIKTTNDLISTKTIDISKGGTSFYLPKRFRLQQHIQIYSQIRIRLT